MLRSVTFGSVGPGRYAKKDLPEAKASVDPEAEQAGKTEVVPSGPDEHQATTQDVQLGALRKEYAEPAPDMVAEEAVPDAKGREEKKMARPSPPETAGPPRSQSLKGLLDEAKSLHERGVAGDKEAVKKAYELLKKLRRLAPQNRLVEAYFGSATALLGRDALDPNERFKKAMKGLKILDESVARASENTEIRTLRGYVSYRLPEMYFHRTATAIEDFAHLVSRYEQDPSVFSTEFYCQLLFDLGSSYKRLGRNQEAESVWYKLLSKTKDAKFLKLLKQEGMDVPDFENIGPKPDPESAAVLKKKDEMLREGIRLHGLALAGDMNAAQGALDVFAKAVEVEPDDPLLKAYHADCMSIAGRQAADPGEMFRSAIQGMKALDSAVNSSPDDVKIRFLRAYQSFRLPEAFFHRTATAVADFEYLAGRYEKDSSIFSRETYHQILYDLGVAQRRLGLEEESSRAWKKLLSVRPNAKYKAMIEEQRGDNLFRDPVRRPSIENRDAYYKEATRLHDLGVAGNKAAAKLALEMWQKAYEKNPGDTVARAYYGSSLALSGRDATDPNSMFSGAIKGLVHINRALSRDRNNNQIRLLRAYLAYSLPEVFFHQTQRAIKDFRYLAMAYEQDKSIFPSEVYHKIMYDLGEAYQRTGDGERARKVWSRLLSENPGPKYEALLRAKVGNTG